MPAQAWPAFFSDHPARPAPPALNSLNLLPGHPAMRASALLLLLCLALPASYAAAKEEKPRRDADGSARKRVSQQLAPACKEALKDRRIVIVLGERSSRGVDANQGSYRAHFVSIAQRLRNLGLRPYSQEEIAAQITPAEIDAYLRDEADAALDSGRKLNADFVLRGVISSRSTRNPALRVPEISVDMGFTLAASDGRPLAAVSARAESYAGNDPLGMALTLVNEQASGIIARLYGDYCRTAGIGRAPQKNGGAVP